MVISADIRVYEDRLETEISVNRKVPKNYGGSVVNTIVFAGKRGWKGGTVLKTHKLANTFEQ